MTFTEAAAQVLRLVGKPLHYKDITDVAIEKDLLSHVGKSPEVTMGARLAALVKKGDKDIPLVRIKPGVFALREWDAATINSGLADRTPALQLANKMEKHRAEQGDNDSADATSAAERSSPANNALSEAEGGVMGEDEKERAELAATASELFSAEEDDDEPIFGGDEEEELATEGSPGDSMAPGGRRRRRRRRGRGRNGTGSSSGNGNGGGGTERDEDDLPSYTVADAPAVSEEGGESRANDVARADEGRDRNRDRDRDRPRDRDSDRERDSSSAAAASSAGGEELSGAALADLAEAALGPFQRQGNAPVRQIAEAIARRRGGADVQQVQAAVVAALRADNLRRATLGQRARFRLSNGRVGLTEWLLDSETLRIERDLQGLAQRYRDAVRRNFVRKLNELPPRAFNELVQLVLERLGYQAFKAVRRAGSHQAEQHFSAKLTGESGEATVAIVIRRDGRDVGRERVTELRGALHHYGPATAGLLVTTGQALGGAREESAAPGAAPVRLIDGAALARLADEQGVGMGHSTLKLPLLDADLFDSMKNGG
ncbi:MAG TPA: HTH domain-containing protein [Polyangiaceae bacterium]|nr:HTH domain-containing protein [Polyangiaceae bacterium]